MNEFRRLSANALREHIATVGAVTFSLRGAQYEGVRNELTEEEKLTVGQIVTDAAATLLFPFAEFVPPLRNGEKVTFLAQTGIKAQTMRVGHIAMSKLSFTLTLQNRDK